MRKRESPIKDRLLNVSLKLSSIKPKVSREENAKMDEAEGRL